jgi:hypothetical protein
MIRSGVPIMFEVGDLSEVRLATGSRRFVSKSLVSKLVRELLMFEA